MKINRTGITRIVLIFKTLVVKIPNFSYSWHHFLKGLIANIQEHQTYKYTKSPLLCPVIWCSWGGWILVMKRADMHRWGKEVRALPPLKERQFPDGTYSLWIEAGFGGDDKADNYGYYNGRLVKVDYGQ